MSFKHQPGSVSQLSRSTVETPAKEQSVHTDTKPSVEHTPLADSRGNSNGGFTLEQGVTPIHRTDAKPALEHIPLTNAQGNPVGGFTLEQSVHCSTPIHRTDTKPTLEHIPLANAQGNPVGGLHITKTQGNQSAWFTPSSRLIQSGAVEVTPKNLSFCAERVASKLDQFRRKSFDPYVKERKVFNGMTLVLDCKPVNGVNFLTVKSNEMKVDGKTESQASDCALKNSPKSETSASDQLSTSPILFATPQSSASPSPVKQELNSFKPVQDEERTGLNSLNLIIVSHESSAIKTVGNGQSNSGNNSISTSKKGEKNAGSQGIVIVKKLFKSRDTEASASLRGGHGDEANEERKPRDILDDVKENFSRAKAGLENCLQATVPKVEPGVDSKDNVQKGVTNLSSKRNERSSKNVSEMPSNVRQGRRKSTRLRRSSNNTGSAKKEEKEACEEKTEDEGSKPVLYCARCGSSLVTGPFASKSFTKHIPDALKSSLLQTMDEKNVLIMEREACGNLNLNSLIDAKNDHSSGMKLNSLYVPENESCYIPQVCRVCHSTNGDSQIVGLEVVSFRTSPEQEQRKTLPVKQVLYCSV
ncbi:hypothetical protein OS493_004205 [Desmophyllum pertusum]|uniref:Uncharacterized protein n=1 Tax=Desmophyllum pertusum TaxID=174260 RepID=A0A9W9ZSV6_9CNID|nr:hypothetical protein OS493_004205 [Desmophyllum pertusum]